MNAKMKVLSLALIASFGYVGAAAAGTCPASPTPPWTAVNALGGTAVIVDGGYAGTACHLASTLTGDASAFATVQDDTPAGEARDVSAKGYSNHQPAIVPYLRLRRCHQI